MAGLTALSGPPAEYWRSLRLYNAYRLALAAFFLFLAWTFGSSLSLGARDWMLFVHAAEAHVLLVAASFVLLHLRRPSFNLQLAIQMGGDILVLTLLSYASGGIQSGIGLLLLVSLAAAGMISRGRIPLFFAALASIAALLEHSYAVLREDALTEHYLQVGLLSIAYFAVAWMAHTLARYAVDSQRLAQRRGHDLASLTEANRLVMRDMQDGVLVVDDHGAILQMNPAAERMLRKSAQVGMVLAEAFPILFGQFALWRQSGTVSRDTLQLDDGVQARLHFVALDHSAQGAVVFLQDMRRVQAEAQQIKLAALGRLTANIAHEVRNPLSSISYAAELLSEEEHDAKQLRLLRIVLDNTQRINRIVQDVMQLNRRDRGAACWLAGGEVLRAFVEEFSQAEHLPAGVLQLSGPPEVRLWFDRDQLRQVLWNLARNAMRHGSGKPGSLQLRVTETALEMCDDGPGVAAERLVHLFEPFFTTAKEGTGLGLYIARELCAANGAGLIYLDRPEGGACFRIELGEGDEAEN